MITLERLPFVGSEEFLNQCSKRPNTRIKVAHSSEIYTGALVSVEGTEYKIRSVSYSIVAKGACFIRVTRLRKQKCLKCKDLDTRLILSYVGERTTAERILSNCPELASHKRLLRAKLRNLVTKGLLMHPSGHRIYFALTNKGRLLLDPRPTNAEAVALRAKFSELYGSK